MTEERIRHRFLLNAELHHAIANQLPGQLARAGDMLTRCLLDGHRILCGGTGAAAANAMYLAALLVNRYERDRPGLPAIALGSDPVQLGAALADHGDTGALVRQLRTLGQAGDILVLFTNSATATMADPLIEAVRDRDMTLLLLDDEDTTAFIDQLTESDLEIAVPVSNAASCQELHLSMVHCLCDIVDLHLFGEEM